MLVFPWLEFMILCAGALLGIVCVMPYMLELSRDAFKKAQERIHQPL